MTPSKGETYLSVLLAVALLTLMAITLSMGFGHGTTLSRAMRVRTELLNVGETEMERLRGVSFDQLESYPIAQPPITGTVTVEQVTARRKRLTIALQHAAIPSQPLILVTYVHQQGLHRSYAP